MGRVLAAPSAPHSAGASTEPQGRATGAHILPMPWGRGAGGLCAGGGTGLTRPSQWLQHWQQWLAWTQEGSNSHPVTTVSRAGGC